MAKVRGGATPPAKRRGARKGGASPRKDAPPPRTVASDATTAKRVRPETRSRKNEAQQPSPRALMELHWGDSPPPPARAEGLVQRWVKRGDALLRHLAEHGAA